MSKTFEQKQVLVKTLKKAVNSFVYSPSEEKKANLSEAMASLSSFIDSIEVPTPEPPKKEAKKKSSKTSKKKPSKASKGKAVRRPKRTSEAGLELTQAKTATANRVGKVKKTKVVHAITEGDAMPFEPRKEVPVIEPKARKKQQMLTLLEGETPQEAMARLRSAQIEAARLEAEALIAETAPF
jgi:hypothetical protein